MRKPLLPIYETETTCVKDNFTSIISVLVSKNILSVHLYIHFLRYKHTGVF